MLLTRCCFKRDWKNTVLSLFVTSDESKSVSCLAKRMRQNMKNAGNLQRTHEIAMKLPQQYFSSIWMITQHTACFTLLFASRLSDEKCNRHFSCPRQLNLLNLSINVMIRDNHTVIIHFHFQRRRQRLLCLYVSLCNAACFASNSRAYDSHINTTSEEHKSRTTWTWNRPVREPLQLRAVNILIQLFFCSLK